MSKLAHTSALMICLALTAVAQSPPVQHLPAQSPQVVEELIGEVADGVLVDGGWQVSPDGRRLAWRTKRDKKWVMIVDGQPGATFDEVSAPVFSPDGQRLAYAVESNNKWMMVVDGKAGPEFDHLSERQPVGRSGAGSWGDAKNPLVWFSPNSKHVAYLAKRGKKWFIVSNGRESAAYEDVKAPFFSSDGEHTAYAAKNAGKWKIVIDGKDHGHTFDSIWPDAWVNIAATPYTRHPQFSPDWHRLVYLGRRKSEWFAVLDGKEIPIGKGVVATLPPCISFSKDLRRFAYLQKNSEGKGFAVVLDGQPGASFDWAGDFDSAACPVLSPDGQHLAYTANRGKAITAGNRQDQFVVVDGQAGPSFKSILGLYFSPDSRPVYMAWQQREKEVKGKVIEVMNGTMREVAEHDKMQKLLDPPTFSPDSQHVAYVLVKDFWAQGYWGQVWDTRPWRMSIEDRLNLLDGKPFGREYGGGGISDAIFSPDSRHLAFVVSHDKVVVGAQEGKAYSQILPETLVFTSPNSVFYIAQRGKSFYRVTQTIQSPDPGPTR